MDKRLIDYKNETPPKKMVQLGEHLRRADGYVFVSAIYNGSVPPALKNLIDHYQSREFGNKPVAIVTYSPGTYGGVQVASHLRDIMAVLQAITLPKAVSIPQVNGAIKDNQIVNERLDRNLDALIEQLLWM